MKRVSKIRPGWRKGFTLKQLEEHYRQLRDGEYDRVDTLPEAIYSIQDGVLRGPGLELDR